MDFPGFPQFPWILPGISWGFHWVSVGFHTPGPGFLPWCRRWLGHLLPPHRASPGVAQLGDGEMFGTTQGTSGISI